MGISRAQALDCFRSDDLVGIGMEADAVRRSLHPEGVVGYAVVGEIDLAAQRNGAEAFADRLAELDDAVEEGCTSIRIAGSAGAELTQLESTFRLLKQRCPSIWLEGLSATELIALALSSGLEISVTLARLRDTGLDAIAGNSADLLGRPDAAHCSVPQWIAVHRAAHRLGLTTAATMTFGAGETLEQRVDFLHAVRSLQEETGAFNAFVPAAAPAPNGRELDGVTAVELLKTLAISRMFLDNIENVQATATSAGLKVLQTELRFGANDAGSIGIEHRSSTEDVRRIIRDAGFIPVERDAPHRTMFLN